MTLFTHFSDSALNTVNLFKNQRDLFGYQVTTLTATPTAFTPAQQTRWQMHDAQLVCRMILCDQKLQSLLLRGYDVQMEQFQDFPIHPDFDNVLATSPPTQQDAAIKIARYLSAAMAQPNKKFRKHLARLFPTLMAQHQTRSSSKKLDLIQGYIQTSELMDMLKVDYPALLNYLPTVQVVRSMIAFISWYDCFIQQLDWCHVLLTPMQIVELEAFDKHSAPTFPDFRHIEGSISVKEKVSIDDLLRLNYSTIFSSLIARHDAFDWTQLIEGTLVEQANQELEQILDENNLSWEQLSPVTAVACGNAAIFLAQFDRLQEQNKIANAKFNETMQAKFAELEAKNSELENEKRISTRDKEDLENQLKQANEDKKRKDTELAEMDRLRMAAKINQPKLDNYEKLVCEKADLQQQKDFAEVKLAVAQNELDLMNESPKKMISLAIFHEQMGSLNVAIFAAEKVKNSVKRFLPSAKFMSSSNKNWHPDAVKHRDVVILHVGYLDHTVYYKVKSAVGKNTRIVLIGNKTHSTDLLISTTLKQCGDLIEDMAS